MQSALRRGVRAAERERSVMLLDFPTAEAHRLRLKPASAPAPHADFL